MPKVNYVAILAAAAAAFGVGAVWYSPLLFGETWMTLRGMDPTAITGASMPAGEMLGEFARWLIVGYVVSRFIARLGIGDPKSALVFGGWMWIAIYSARGFRPPRRHAVEALRHPRRRWTRQTPGHHEYPRGVARSIVRCVRWIIPRRPR